MPIVPSEADSRAEPRQIWRTKAATEVLPLVPVTAMIVSGWSRIEARGGAREREPRVGDREEARWGSPARARRHTTLAPLARASLGMGKSVVLRARKREKASPGWTLRLSDARPEISTSASADPAASGAMSQEFRERRHAVFLDRPARDRRMRSVLRLRPRTSEDCRHRAAAAIGDRGYNASSGRAADRVVSDGPPLGDCGVARRPRSAIAATSRVDGIAGRVVSPGRGSQISASRVRPRTAIAATSGRRSISAPIIPCLSCRRRRHSRAWRSAGTAAFGNT